MLNTIIKIIDTEAMCKACLVKEFKNKLPKYTTSEGNIDTHEGCEVSKCITLPIGPIHTIVKIAGVDRDNIVNYNLFGQTTSKLLSLDHIELSDIVINNDEIVIINRLMKILDRDEESYNDGRIYTLNIKTISSICDEILDCYLRGDVVGASCPRKY